MLLSYEDFILESHRQTVEDCLSFLKKELDISGTVTARHAPTERRVGRTRMADMRQDIPGQYTVRVPYLGNMYQIVRSLSHEMVHVKQYDSGRMVHVDRDTYSFDGRDYRYDDYAAQYDYLPHEIEARNMEGELAARYWDRNIGPDDAKESLSFHDGVLGVHPGGSARDIVDVSLGKALGKLRSTTVMKDPDVRVYSVYAKNPGADLEGLMSSDVLKILKGQSELGIVDAESLNFFVNRAAIMAAGFIQREGFDLLVSMQSSSELCNQFMDAVVSKVGVSPSLVKHGGAFKVSDPDRVTIDGSKISDKTVKGMETTLAKIRRDGYFSIRKFDNRFRKFVHGWVDLSFDPRGKRVALFDDYLSTGATMAEAAHTMLERGAKSVIGITLLK